MNNHQPVWAIVGGGNGGQSLAAHLGLMEFTVRLYDIFPDTVDAIQNQGGIHVNGAVNGFGKVALATTDLSAAVAGADVIMVVAPAIAHHSIAKACAPLLQNGQILFVHPGATGGALEFAAILEKQQCAARVTIAESNSLLYACRSRAPGHTSILGIKKELMVAALPAVDTSRALSILNTAFPQMVAGKNVLETSLGNPNAMMHPAPTLLNTSLIESDRDWLYYWDGITPSIGAFVEAMDRERMAIGAALDLTLPPIRQWYAEAYGAVGDTLSQAVKNNPAYENVAGQHSLRTRYLLEDIPTGLIPMASLAKLLGVDAGRIETIIALGRYVLDDDLAQHARTVETLGLAGMTAAQIQQYLLTGAHA